MSAGETMVEHHLGPVEQIPLGEAREFVVDGQRVAVFRLRSGTVAATQAECPHRAGPLADGTLGMDSVVCPLHNWRFALHDGASQQGDCHIAVHPIRLDDGAGLVLTLPGA